MWRIEIRENERGERPGKLFKTYLSELPDRSKLVRLEHSAIMTRLFPASLPKEAALCKQCRRVVQFSDYIQKRTEIRNMHKEHTSTNAIRQL